MRKLPIAMLSFLLLVAAIIVRRPKEKERVFTSGRGDPYSDRDDSTSTGSSARAELPSLAHTFTNGNHSASVH